MEKYYRVSDVNEILNKLAKEPAYYHDGESFYNGVCAVEGELMCLEPVEADIDELKKEVADLNNRRHLIWAIGVDYDGCNTVESLKELIDELVSYTQLPREQVPDITSRTGKWIRVDNHRWKCTACGKETDLPHYDGAYYCFNCGAKMKESTDE
jgi:DNA-directed RNA polymerase subunit RPC12/RpoP